MMRWVERVHRGRCLSGGPASGEAPWAEDAWTVKSRADGVHRGLELRQFELEREGLKIKLVKRVAVGNGTGGAGVPAVHCDAGAPRRSPSTPRCPPAAVESRTSTW